MPPKSEARQAQALPTFRCTIVVSPPPSLTHSPDRPAAPTVIILMMTTIVLFLVPIVRPQMQVNVRDRSHSLFLSFSLSLSLFPFCCANRCTSCQKKGKKEIPDQDRSQKRAKGAAVKPPTRQPTPSTARGRERESEPSTLTEYDIALPLFNFFEKLICAACAACPKEADAILGFPLALSPRLRARARHDRPV